MDLWQRYEAVLHCHDDPDQHARARPFYEANREAMDARIAARCKTARPHITTDRGYAGQGPERLPKIHQ
jgi:hypothetical protein